MSRFYNSFFIIFFSFFFFSCATHTQSPPKRHIPPAPPKSSAQSPAHVVPQNKFYSSEREQIVQHALSSIGAHYKWGGQSPNEGFDCSGLVVYAHKKAKIFVPRMTSDQIKNGRSIQLADIQPGDLVFFKNPKKSRSLHVGLYVGDGHFVHSPGKGRTVTIANLANPYFKSNYIGTRSYTQ